MEKYCINCLYYDGVEGSGVCELKSYSWAVSDGYAKENNLLLYSVPVKFNDEEKGETIGHMNVTTMAGNSCSAFTKASDEHFCKECGRRLVSMFPSYCHNCGAKVISK